MKTLKFVVGVFIAVLFFSSCQQNTSDKNGITDQIDEKVVELDLGEKIEYDEIFFLEDGSVDLERTCGMENVPKEERAAATIDYGPSYIYVNLGYYGDGYTLTEATTIASFIPQTNTIHDEYGCDLLLFKGIFPQVNNSSRFYVQYQSINSPEGDYENYSTQVHMTPSCSCGQGGIITKKLVDDHYIFQIGVHCFVNTLRVDSYSLWYCE